MEHVCACARVCVCVRVLAQGSYFEGDYVSVAAYPVITAKHDSGNFLTAHSSGP
jgi:hypothetical protein